MNTIRCAVPGCVSQFETSEPVAFGARFICKNHKRSEQVKAIGRRYNSNTDEVDSGVHFQDHQFDKDIRRTSGPLAGRSDNLPIPANHIWTQEEIERMRRSHGVKIENE